MKSITFSPKSPADKFFPFVIMSLDIEAVAAVVKKISKYRFT